MSVTTASAKLLDPVLQLAQHYRLDSSMVLESAALSHDDFNKPGARFPCAHFNHVLKTLALATNNPHIALNLGETTQPRALGSIGFLMSTAPTLCKAYQALINYFPLLFEGAVLQMEQTDEGTLLTFDTNDSQLLLIEYFLAWLVNIPRWLTGQQVPTSAVYLAFPKPEEIQPYQQFFAAEVQFNAPRNQVLLANEYLTLHCLDANTEIHQLHKEFADSLLSMSDQDSALVSQTRNLIRHQLNEQQSTVRREQIADCLGLSLRTLQRKLGVLGTSFQDIYDQTRHEVSLQLIHRGQLSFGEIAFYLGFSNQSAFQKAFKRWMGIAPSLYRQQIKPTVFPDTDAIVIEKPRSLGWLTEDNLEEKITQHFGTLNSVTLELLEYASLLGDQFDLIELSLITEKPESRVATHLWPAEQEGLITALAVQQSETDSQTDFGFTHAAIRSALNRRMSRFETLQKHARIGHSMLHALPTPFSLQQISTVLYHLNRGIDAADDKQHTKLQHLNMLAAAMAQAQQDFHSAGTFLEQARRFLQNHSPDKIEIILQHIEVLLLGGDTDTAQQTLQQIPADYITAKDAIRAALMQAEVYQYRGLYEHSLSHLLDSLARLDQPLPENESAQLSLLSRQLLEIRERFDVTAFSNMEEITDQKQLLTLRLLEQISLIARQQSQPLLAACAISRMTELSLRHGQSNLTAFSFISYAWVSSWFCADYRLAQTFSKQGIQLTKPLGSVRALLVQNSQVQHWFVPLSNVMVYLHQIDEIASTQNKWLIQSECRLLKHQLSLFSSTTLDTQMQQCRIDHQAMLDQGQTFQANCLRDSTLVLLEQLCGESSFPQNITYLNGWQATSHIIGALLLDQQQHWQMMYEWEPLLENELPGYFSFSEVLFCTAIMRLIQAQKQHTLGRRRRLEIEQIESRMELWSHYCPDNFNGQWLLIQAELSRLSDQEKQTENETSRATALLFEKAIKATEINDLGYHQALCYERYSDYLHNNGQIILARFCLNKAIQLYQNWGAVSKTKQLGQVSFLLAESLIKPKQV